MTGPLAQPPAGLGLVAEHAAQLYALEQAAQLAAAGPLRTALARVLRFLTRRWISSFGSTTTHANPVTLINYVAEVRHELRAIVPHVAEPLEQHAIRARQLGVQQAVDEVLVDIDLTAVEAEGLPDDVQRALDEVDGQVARKLADADRAFDQLTGDSFDDMLVAFAHAQQAATTADRAASWVTNRAANSGVEAVADELGVERIWLAERDACVVCLALSGTTSVDGKFDAAATFGEKPLAVWPGPDLTSPPRHPNCVIGSVRVATPGQGVVPRDEADVLPLGVVDGIASTGDVGPLAAPAVAQAFRHSRWVAARATTERDFVGDVVVLRTALGYELTCTPNHPIATRGGWVAAAELRVGDHVLSSTGREWRTGPVYPHEDHIPPVIEEVAQALPVGLLPMPLAPEDFHGDGGGSEVCVVRTNGSLMADDQPLCAKHAGDHMLGLADVQAEPFAALGVLTPLGVGVPGAADGVVGGAGQPSTLLGAGLRHAGVHGGAAPAGFDSSVGEDTADGRAADAEGFCERLLADSSPIALDEVVNVRTVPFRGHVYNLETPDGWYISNGIVSHNCRCRTQPWLGSTDNARGPDLRVALRREAARSIATGWRRPSESERVRLGAAERLLAAGTTLPKSVQARARAAIRRGQFDTFPRITTR